MSGDWQVGDLAHTPGPWAAECDAVFATLPNGAAVEIARINVLQELDTFTEYANACLVASAPELLEALQELLAHPGIHHGNCIYWTQVGCDCEYSEVANNARAAIAKARGHE